MSEAVRDELAEAALAYFALEPWARLSGADLFGVRDEESGISACARILGGGGVGRGLALCLGPEGFALLERVKAGERFSDEVFYAADVLSLSALLPGEAAVPRDMRVAEVGAQRLWAFRKPRGERMRAPADAEARLLARVLFALAREARANRLPPPRAGGDRRELPFLVLAGKGRRTRSAWARVESPSARLTPPPRLFVPPHVRRAIETRPTVSPWIATLLEATDPVAGKPVRLFVVYDPRRDRIVHAERCAGVGGTERAGEALLEALSGSGPAGTAPGRPVEISTDSAALAAYVGGPLGGLGIRVCLRAWVTGLGEIRRRLAEHLGERSAVESPGSNA
ncbi:MAG TPA: hypothetical protein VFI25_17905 [Planctomycetota bacterium]|nr:hypothetical protein [Planctomycetota bacterium]